jgi:hypothetical protein
MIDKLEMERDQIIKIMKEKIKLGWNFERTYNHLLIIDDLQKINKQPILSDENTADNFNEKS